MNLRTVYLLFGVLLGVLFLFGLSQMLGWRQPGATSDWVLPAAHDKKGEVKTSDIDKVELTRTPPGGDGKETLVFTRTPGGWELQQPHKLRVQPFLVDGLVDQVLRARRDPSEIGGNLEELGLKDPAAVVQVFKGDRSWGLNVSRPGPIKGAGGVVYVSAADRPKDPVAVKYADLDSLFKPLKDFRARDLVTASSFTAAGLELHGQGKDVVLEKTPEGTWRFKQPPYGPAEFEGEPAATPAAAGARPVGSVRDLLDAVNNVRVECDADFVAEGVSEADLASRYGLATDKPETLTIKVQSNRVGGEGGKQPVTETLLVGKKVTPEKKDDKKDTPAEPPADSYYARMTGDEAVVRVPASRVEPLLKLLGGLEALRDRSLVQADASRKDRVDAVTLKNSTGEVVLRKPAGGDWKVYRGGTGLPTEPAAVRDLIDALTDRKQVKTFVDKDEGLEFDKPQAVVSLWFDGLKSEETKEDGTKEEKKEGEPALRTDKPSAVLTFGKRDRDKGLVYVRREAGEDRTVVTVADALLDRVTAGPLAFAERKLPSFGDPLDPAKGVTKLALLRGGATVELTREKEGDKDAWKFTQPKEFAGRTANLSRVQAILRDLALLRPDKLVAEKPTESDLDQIYGLKNPALRATVTVTHDGKPEEWAYSFGKEADPRTGLFGRVSQKDVVFAVPPDRVASLQADLRDPNVFGFDLAKVQGVKISGWKESAGRVDTLEAERKGDKWEVKAPAGFNLDPDALQSFLGGLTALRADRFVSPKAGTKSGLDPNEGALVVEVRAEGDKPQTLTLGGEDPENKGMLFATSSKQPGDVFLVPRAAFDKPKERIGFFARK